MPAITFYPDNHYLSDVLQEALHFYTNRDLYSGHVMDQVYKIFTAWKAGKNPYICRARYQNWVDEWFYPPGMFLLGNPPEWEILMRDEDWGAHFEELGFYEDGSFEWAIYTDGHGMDVMLDEVKTRGINVDVVELMTRMAMRDVQTLIFFDPGMGALYVIKSPFVGNFSSTPSGNHTLIFEGCIEAGEEGDCEGYALDIRYLQAAVDSEEAEEEENRSWQARKGQA